MEKAQGHDLIGSLEVGDRLSCKEGVFTIVGIDYMPLDEVPDPFKNAYVESPHWEVHPRLFGLVERFVSIKHAHAMKVKLQMRVPDGVHEGEFVAHPLWSIGPGFERVEDEDARD